MSAEGDGDLFAKVACVADAVFRAPGLERYAQGNKFVAPARVVQRAITPAGFEALLFPGLGTGHLQVS